MESNTSCNGPTVNDSSHINWLTAWRQGLLSDDQALEFLRQRASLINSGDLIELLACTLDLPDMD